VERIVSFSVAALLLVCLSATSAITAEKVRVASGGFTPLHSIIWAAHHQDIFKKYGLDTEYLALNSGTLGVQTLLANEIQFLFSTGALAVSANLQGGDIVIITGGFNVFPFKFVARPEIKSAEGLRAKRVSISQFGSATDFAVQAALEKLGLDPKQVTIIQLGGNPNRLAALSGGSTEATVFSEPFATLAIKKHGMNLLLDMAEARMAFPQSSLMVKRSYLDANRDTVINFVKALIEGLFLVKRDKALAIQLMKKYIRAEDEVYGIGYDFFLTKYGDDLLSLPERKGLDFVIVQSAKTNPRAKGQSPESLRLLEPSVLDEIKKTGFVERLRKS
jgi:NitT/TauT family transport system substrate-binding protein